ncbi:MAG: PAS domain S-box protein [Deltaproteobacteria bacterium]|nr:PAS domain S-box protein [Deltaproteobacteria bacterium]
MDLHNKSVAAILNNLSDAFMIMDANGRINYFNDVAARITGHNSIEARGMKCKDILKTAYCEIDCPFNNQNITPKTNYKRELEITRKDGTKLPVECTRNILIDSDGLMFGAIETFKDISQIKSLENSLKYSEFKYRRLFENTKDMVFIISLEGLFLDINQAMVDLLDYKEKEDLYLLGNIEHIFIDPIHWHVCKKQIDLNGFIQDFEVGFKKSDGTRLHGCLSANVFLDDNENIIGYEGIAKDITARMDSFRNLYKHHQELLLLNTVALTINSSQNLDDVLDTALNSAMKLLNFSMGTIFLINHNKAVFELHTHKGLPEQISQTTATPIFHDTQLMTFFLGKENRLTPKSIFPSFKITLKNPDNTKPIIFSCFLITEKKWPSGFMAFPAQETNELSLEDFHLLGSLGNFLGGAIANIKLIQTVRKHRGELKHLTARLFQSQEIECKRIARELHDETGSALIGINFNLEAVEKIMPSDDPVMKNIINNITQQINHTYQEMRRISHLLHPALLTDLGLEPALDSYLGRIAKQSSMDIDFKMIGFTGRVNPDIETVLYRFSQEALSNTIKYAKATFFKLSIIRGYPSIIFIAEDDGTGFDPDESNHERPSLGLLSMRERTAILGGKFFLRTGKGKGTRIRIEIPIKNGGLSTLIEPTNFLQEIYET